MNFQQFIQKFKELKQKYPVPPTRSYDNENADYADYIYHCKNAYYSFDDAQCSDIVYIFDSFKAANSLDGDYVVESESCYECVDVFKAYNSTYLNYCARIYDSHFCWDCNDSNNLFGCVHLKFQKYCIFNKQYTKEEYEQKIKELLKRPPEENLGEMKKLAKKYPVTTTNVSNSENCDYCNHVHYSKNLYLCFDSAHSEDSGYLYDSHWNKNSYNFYQSHHSQWCYECVDSSRLNNCFFMKDSHGTYDSAFSEFIVDSNNVFGCYGLNKKEYCILNKQYSKEDYEKRVKEIMESL